MMRHEMAFLVMLMLGYGLNAQTAKDYFHQGAQQYIFGKKQEAIASVQQGLQIDPNDNELKELYEILMKEEEEKKDKNQNEDKKDEEKNDDEQNQDQKQDQEKEQNQEQQNKQQSQPQQMSKEDMEKLLQALQMEEEKLQKKLQKRKVKVVRKNVTKDW
ncbi:MAG: hypothetical protein MRZ79_21190 [Bacteroidia bacterium]|nr:hypothetical protein [Bacteroidia bacterium]